MMERLLDSRIRGVVARAKWKECGTAGASSSVSEMDVLLENMDSIFLEKEQVIVHTGIPLLTEYHMKWADSYWNDIITKYNISISFALYRECVNNSNRIPMNPQSIFLDTHQINPTHPFHEVMMGRVSETMTFGLLKTIEWYNFFSFLSGGKCKELSFIAGLVRKSQGMPFKVKRGDNSVVDDIKLFYNIQNIIECCLNICDLRFSLLKSQIELHTSSSEGFVKIFVNLDEVLDEAALRIAVSPKVNCEKIKRFLTYAIRVGGAYAHRQATFKHDDTSFADRMTSGSITKVEFDGYNHFKHFLNTSIMIKLEEAGRNILKDLKMHKLLHLIDTYLKTSLVKTDPYDFVLIGSFFQKLMSVSGYGRALNFSSSPRSAEPLSTDLHGVADDIKNIVIELDHKAIKSGILPPTGDRWIPTCVASWKSTSAGVGGIKARVNINGTDRTVRISKKTAVGALYGPKTFSRKMLSERTSVEKPGCVGFRDVPYRATRAIYVINLPVLCAQNAIMSHIVDYASTRGLNGGRIDAPIDASHFTTGPSATSGIRVFDNMDTIKSSGDLDVLAIGTDLSSFDSHCILWNFRRPMISALQSVGAGRTYGPDNITQIEMLDYAFGKGRIDESLWDNGREPIIYVKEVDLEHFVTLDGYLRRVDVPSKRYNYRVLHGAKTISNETIYIFDLTKAIEDGIPYPELKLNVGVLMDGSDLVFLTSEASGEKSTLTMNTVANLAMQRIALKKLKSTKFGQKYNPIFQKGVGDDSEWIGTLGVIEGPEEIEEALLLLEKIYKEMGHLFSPSKTFVLPLSSEFVQTFARFGLYIPRDQIPVIASEKPRDIRNPVAFLNSFKSILLAKLARGMNADYAYLLFYFHQRKITELILKRHDKIYKSPSIVKLSIPDIHDLHVELANVLFKRNSEKPTLVREEVRVFRFSTAISYLPTISGGGGLNPLLMGIIHSPAFFLQFISKYDKNFQNMMYGVYVFMSNQDINDGSGSGMSSDSSQYRVKLSSDFTPFTVEQLFSSNVRKSLERSKIANIGRLDARNVPRQLMMNGIQMEKFMHVETNYVREEYAERFLSRMFSKLKNLSPKHDEWILNFKFKFSEIPASPKLNLFWTGLNDSYEVLLRTYGLTSLNTRLHNFADRLRMIISRDPVLRSLRTPDEVISILDKFGVVSELDRDVGFLVLSRMGFEHNVACAILEARFSSQDETVQEKTFGMFADDFLGSLNLMTKERMLEISFPCGFDMLAKRLLLAFGLQAQIFNTFFHGRLFELVSIEDASSNSTEDRAHRFTRVPRTLRKVLQSRRNTAGILLALSYDLSVNV